MSLDLIFYLYSLHKLRKNQWLGPSELEKLQFDKLKALLHHAYYKVDYYHRLFECADIKPEDIKDIQVLAKIPTTTRKELQSLPKEDIVAKDADKLHLSNLRTSGSTGMPLNIFVGSREIILRWLLYRRMYFDNGGKLSDKELRIVNYQKFKDKQWFQRLGILRVKNISLFEDIENQMKAILEYKPEIIRSQGSTLKNLAAEINNKKIKIKRPRIIFSTSELLTKQDKALISSMFRAELFDYYTCNECGTIAWECKKHTGYHINSDSVIIEFLKEDGTKAKAGEEGEIVITSLNSYTMPFIRYKLGDIGVPSDEQCPCGRTFPLMKIISGRVNDHIILPDGRKISPYTIMSTMDGITEIKKYQILQEKENKIKLSIFQYENFSEKTITRIHKRFKAILDYDLEIEYAIVKEVPHEKNSKFQVIFSNACNNNK